MTIKIDPLKLDAIDLEALERDAYAAGETGIAALVGKLIVSENRWLFLQAFVDTVCLEEPGAAQDIVDKMIELEEKPS